VAEFPVGDELLAIFVRAERAGGTQRTRFRALPDLTTGALVRHPGLPGDGSDAPGVLHCNRQDIEALRDRGFLRLDKKQRAVPGIGPKRSAEEWEFDVTDEGFSRVAAMSSAAVSAPEGRVPGLAWATDVVPVLEAAYELTPASDPQQGVRATSVNERLGREPNDRETGRVLISLVDADYVIPVIDNVNQLVGPYSFRLSERALQLVAGWPAPGSGDQLIAQLIAVLDEQIAGAQGEERSKLERLRDTVLGVGHDVLIAVLADFAKRAGGELH
jgi:hypothetical protein